MANPLAVAVVNQIKDIIGGNWLVAFCDVNDVSFSLALTKVSKGDYMIFTFKLFLKYYILKIKNVLKIMFLNYK